MFSRSALPRFLMCCLFFGASIARAQIVIGQSAGFTGPVAEGVKELTAGAKLYIDSVNGAGGIDGQKIELISLDDKFTPALTAENVQTLVMKHKAVALFLLRGTPHTQAATPIATRLRVPIVAPSTGASLLHEPVNPWIFNVRSRYQLEAERAVALLHTTGLTRIGIVHVDDSFGADVRDGALRGFAAAGIPPQFVETFDRTKWDFTNISEKVKDQNAQAVIVIGAAKVVAEAVAAIRGQGSSAQVITLSNNASQGFINLLGQHARGVVVSQVFPNARSGTTAFAREALKMAKENSSAAVLTPAALEGFAAAKVLVEGLRRSTKPVTGVSLQGALNGLGAIDLGGLKMDYSPTDHTGLTYVDLSIISAEGTFRR